MEGKIESNQKAIIILGFFLFLMPYPNRGKKTSKFKHPKKGPKTCQDIAKPDTPIFAMFSKRDTDREKVGQRCFLKINTTRTNCQQTKKDGF
jgi:hypothetical protein